MGIQEGRWGVSRSDRQWIWAVALGAVNVLAGEADFRFVQGDGYLDLFRGDVPVYRHETPVFNPAKHGDTFKTFHHVYGFHGEGMLTKGPGGLYPHHRGLFLGWSKTTTAGKEMDSWHGTNGSSSRHVKYLPEREIVGAEKAQRASVTEWTESDGTVLVRDTREVTAYFPAPGKLYLDWTITIASATGQEVSLDGDPQHAGFQFRADSLITTFEYMGPADKTGTGDVWTMKDANSWAVNKFSLKGHGYAVMQMDHPKNPRPVVVSHRDYGRFGHYFTAKIPADKPLTIYFRTLVWDTDLNPAPTLEQAQALYNEFAKVDPLTGITLAGDAGALGKRRNGAELRLILIRKSPAAVPASLGTFSLQGRFFPQGEWLAPGAAVIW